MVRCEEKVTDIADLEVSFFKEVRSMHASKSVVQGLALSAALLFTLLFWARTGALAQGSMATLRGMVQDQSGAPGRGELMYRPILPVTALPK